MKIPQLSVFLENRSHSLLEPLQALATAGINLSGITLADSEQFGILRLVLRDWSRARDLLQSAGWAVTVTDMVAIDVDDQPGGARLPGRGRAVAACRDRRLRASGERRARRASGLGRPAFDPKRPGC